MPAAAFANDSSADIGAPLRAEATARPNTPAGDQEFHALFASWRALDATRQGLAGAAPTAGGPYAPHGNFAVVAARQGFVGGAPSFSATSLPMSIPSRMPVANFRMTSDFGMRWHPILGGRRPHKGIDLADPTGTPVFATADGIIGRADWFSGYGLYIAIEHGGNLETRYGHLSRLNVAAGQSVHKGDLIGFVGSTGRATGPHLHYEVRVDGVAVNPLPYMYGQATRVTVSRAAAMATAPSGEVAEAEGDE